MAWIAAALVLPLRRDAKHCGRKVCLWGTEECHILLRSAFGVLGGYNAQLVAEEWCTRDLGIECVLPWVCRLFVLVVCY